MVKTPNNVSRNNRKKKHESIALYKEKNTKINPRKKICKFYRFIKIYEEVLKSYHFHQFPSHGSVVSILFWHERRCLIPGISTLWQHPPHCTKTGGDGVISMPVSQCSRGFGIFCLWPIKYVYGHLTLQKTLCHILPSWGAQVNNTWLKHQNLGGILH